MSDEKFYDIHMHAMNLSHPNLLAFIQRFRSKVNLALWANSAAGPVVSFFVGKKLNKFKNLLAVMENDLGSYFLLMEECLKHGPNPILQDGAIHIGVHTYKKIVLTPLMMDFGYKDKKIIAPKIHYSPPLHKLWEKPIVEQVVDVFNGIKKYREQSLDKVFEIYPFLGLNTKNYPIEKLEKMLNKYFSDYALSQTDLHLAMGMFDGDIDNMGSNFFAGIKVYPPLGFDPWPDEQEERDKVKLLYRYCCQKKIPITAHCNDGGFAVASKKEIAKYTSPERWGHVLNHGFETLKLNLAHFGDQKKRFGLFPRRQWVKKILELMGNFENVYTDFSYSGARPEYYKLLRKTIDTAPEHLKEKLLGRINFGSDFMIVLGATESYSEYLDMFSNTTYLKEDEKKKFGCDNPARFLFG